MKATNDKEMDVLLSRLAQRNKTVNAAGVGRADDGLRGHLDADEMNALAENALPEITRVRYMSHLADCDSCRKLVTELAMTASVATRIEDAPAPDKSTRRSVGQMLAALFALPAFRYGVPALAMIALVAVVLVALRQRERGEFVAQVQPASDNEKQVRVPTTATTESAPSQAATPRQKQPVEQVAPGAPAGKDQGAAGNTNSDLSRYSGSANAPQPGFAPEPNNAVNERDKKFMDAPTALPPAKPEPSNSLKPAARASADERAPATHDTLTAQKEEQLAKRDREATMASPPKSGTMASENKSKASPRRAREQSESEGKSAGIAGLVTAEVSQETRKVSGHTFRRQNSTWVDVNYSSSFKLTTLTIGSKKYLSIVNNEPGLRAVAEQLGDVIVVWNGKAYRIH
ncbi:MAG: hypothetical protein ABJC05_07345 [Pyrinomonadaceae bacterium]